MPFGRPRLPPPKPPQLIELTKYYPCPCCHQGQLRVITLTEAFGCDRCQNIFSLTPDHLHLEQLAVSYPYRKVWFWNGLLWCLEREETPQGLAVTGIVGILTILAGVLLIISRIGWGLELLGWIIVIAVCVVLGFLAILILLRS